MSVEDVKNGDVMEKDHIQIKTLEKPHVQLNQPTRCSARIPKRPKRDNTPPPSPPKKSITCPSRLFFCCVHSQFSLLEAVWPNSKLVHS